MTQTAKKGLLSTFPRVFWVANVMELFERAAYYGMNSVLAVYLTNSAEKGGLGFSENSVGFLQSLVYACTYVVPILGGALADRYGYRRMLIFAFSLMSAGYFVTGEMSVYGAVFASLLLMAVGSGLFKPIISGTIARTTTEENSGFGFGVYYWMINLGAFAAPLVVSQLKGFKWSYVFVASSLYCALMLLPTLFLFQDPPKPKSTKSFKDVLAGAALVLSDARFMLMIVVYSGFWILYFQNFGSVLWYLRDFVDPRPLNDFFGSVLHIPLKFDAEHVTVVNAGTIILLQVLVSRIVKNWKPLPTMVTGIAIGALGFLCLASSRSIWVFVLGIAVFSVGEMTAHPKYYSYVGLVAPKEKTAVYMGYAFLYGVIGSLAGSSFGGAMYEALLKPLAGKEGIDGQLRMFWLIFVALDVVALLGLLAYNKFFAEDTPRTNEWARKVMLVGYSVILAGGCLFFYRGVSGAEISYKTVVQSVIMVVLGGGGIGVSLGRKHENIPGQA